MATMSMIPITFSLLLLFLSLSSADHHHHLPTSDLIHTSCLHATFPTLCLHTLSSSTATTPNQLAQAAVKLSLSRATKSHTFLSTLLNSSSGSGDTASRRQKGALSDCVTQLSDSVDDLRKTLSELKELRRSTFRWQMSNALTWVSAALTNEDTCLDGFKEVDEQVRSDVKRKITNVARVTSNALYLINCLDQGA